LTTITYPAA